MQIERCINAPSGALKCGFPVPCPHIHCNTENMFRVCRCAAVLLLLVAVPAVLSGNLGDYDAGAEQPDWAQSPEQALLRRFHPYPYFPYATISHYRPFTSPLLQESNRTPKGKAERNSGEALIKFGPAGRIFSDPKLGPLQKWQRPGKEHQVEAEPTESDFIPTSKRYACRFKFCRIFSNQL